MVESSPLDFPARLWYKKINAIEPNRPVRGASCSFAFNITTYEFCAAKEKMLAFFGAIW